LCNLAARLHKAKELPKEGFKREVERHFGWQRNGTLGDYLLQALHKPPSEFDAPSPHSSEEYVVVRTKYWSEMVGAAKTAVPPRTCRFMT
jgi:hypothetical protein